MQGPWILVGVFAVVALATAVPTAPAHEITPGWCDGDHIFLETVAGGSMFPGQAQFWAHTGFHPNHFAATRPQVGDVDLYLSVINEWGACEQICASENHGLLATDRCNALGWGEDIWVLVRNVGTDQAFYTMHFDVLA